MGVGVPGIMEGVWYVAPDGVGQLALVNNVLPRPQKGYPHLNLTVVSRDKTKHDQYGRQNEGRIVDVPHESDRAEGGHYWRRILPPEP